MSKAPFGDGTDTQDGEILADLFDVLLQEILEGRTPDLAQYHPDRPDLRERIQKTWALACSVAGRREPSRPVLGGYEIVRELGHGGMGTVYLARHQLLQRDVAIKVLPHSLAMSPRAKQRFLEEAKALARLRHAQVVQIHRIIDQSEMLAFEMEYIGGPSLQTLIGVLQKSDKPRAIETLATVLGVPAASLPRNTTEWCVRLGIDMARAIAEVHRHGLVHRDVKPSNILLRPDGTPVLADFGLARFDDLDATHTVAFAGTPIYAAPERLRGGDTDVDARADVYSLGVTLYELLALQAPFAGPSTTEVLRRIETGQQLPLRKQAPQVSRDLETVIQKAMDPDPQHRYATAEAFAEDLERLLSLQPILARPAGPLRRTLKFLGRHRRVVLAACAGALLVAGAAWPVFAHERSLAGVREQAATALLDARTKLLSPESLHDAWSRAFTGVNRQLLRRPTAGSAQAKALAVALDAYDRAASLDAGDGNVALERAVVHSALAIRNSRDADAKTPELAALGAGMPPLTARLMREFAAGQAIKLSADELIATAATDRFGAGLLGFLLGDLATSHACWTPIADALQDRPLFDACFALQLASDGFPERAYQRLFHAARVFPGATSLALAMAESALAMGDTTLAEHWLRSLPAADADETAQSRRRLLQADLLAATGQNDGAARIYRDLIRLDNANPTPVQRLATQALDGGDFDTAARLLRLLRQRWPDLALAHLETARLALLRRDLPGYLAEVRHVLSEDLTQTSRGSASQLVEIARLGGLGELHRRLLAKHDLRARASLHSSALPLSHWLPAHVVRTVQQSIDTMEVVDRASETARVLNGRAISGALEATWLASLMLPGATLSLPQPAQASLLLGIPALLQLPVNNAAMLLVPLLRTLGDPMQLIQMRLIVESEPDEGVIFAAQIERVRDLDGDTVDELCIASPAPSVGPELARVEVRSLQDGTLLRTLRNADPDVSFGHSIAVLGDVDGDLCDDVLVGAPQSRPAPTVRGEVHLCSGRTGQRLWVISREISSFGVSIAALDDVDGDGVRDFVAGASPPTFFGEERGRAFVCSGRTGEQLRELVAERSGTWFGGCVANAGDVDADGHDDALVTGNYGGAPGLATVFSLTTGAALMSFTDDEPGHDFGKTARGLGDVDGDRHSDFAIGAPATKERDRPGSVQIFSGRTGKVRYELTGDDPGDGFGDALYHLPSWKGGDRDVIAVGSRRGGPLGSGYVRILYAASGSPAQTIAGNPGVVRFCHSLADLGDLDGDGMRDLGIASIRRDGGGVIWPMSWALLKPARGQ